MSCCQSASVSPGVAKIRSSETDFSRVRASSTAAAMSHGEWSRSRTCSLSALNDWAPEAQPRHAVVRQDCHAVGIKPARVRLDAELLPLHGPEPGQYNLQQSLQVAGSEIRGRSSAQKQRLDRLRRTEPRQFAFEGDAGIDRPDPDDWR